jgi:hypothetical protein
MIVLTQLREFAIKKKANACAKKAGKVLIVVSNPVLINAVIMDFVSKEPVYVQMDSMEKTAVRKIALIIAIVTVTVKTAHASVIKDLLDRFVNTDHARMNVISKVLAEKMVLANVIKDIQGMIAPLLFV